MKLSTLLAILTAFVAAGIAFFFTSAKIRVAVELLGWRGFFQVARDTIATRTLGVRETLSRTAFQRLVDTLSEVDVNYCVPNRRVSSEIEIAECHRLISHLTATGFRLFFESDLEHPHFEPIVGPRMKTLGDNPDAFYYSTVFQPKKEFVVKGKVLREVYLSLTVYETPCVGCFSAKVVADINHRQLQLGKDGSFEIVISPHPKPNTEKRDWLWIGSLSEGSFPQLITRHYYEDELSAQLDPSVRQVLSIEPTKPATRFAPARLTDVESAERMERVRAFVRSHSLEMQQDPSKAPSWFSFTPNKFGPAVLFRNEVEGVGAVDIVYSAGPFKLDNPDTQGLIITGRMPRAAFANIALWNKLLQTFSYETGRQVSLNRRQMKRSKLDAKHLTGPFRILLSKRVPLKGLPSDMEWLDTEGRDEGTMFWRFLLPEEEVETPRAELVDIDDVK